MRKLSEHLFLFADTCNVYVLVRGQQAVLIDFGSGAVLEHLAGLGVQQVTDVLMTHHHRDQGQGLYKAVEAGIPIRVPQAEQELFHSVDAHWQAREIYVNYLMRQDRFSLLESVAVAGTLNDYAEQIFGGYPFTVVPTPGHTTGSITLMTVVDDKQVAFSGDLIMADGKLWTLSATQWSYNGAEGAAASIPSLLDLKQRQPDVILPSHGAVIEQPMPTIDLLIDRLWQLLQVRGHNLHLFDLIAHPYEFITPHLIRHRASFANIYALISETREALMIDFGFDLVTSLPNGSDRASRRPWLYTIPQLKAQYAIEKITTVVPTHYHDDHVAGINLLRDVEGTQVWAADLFADILEQPARYDLPCLWYEPIPVDKRLPLETAVQWNEYTLTLYHLPGHTRYAVAIDFEVDGKRVLATGDQYQGSNGLELNYVYANRFQSDEYLKSAALYRQLQPNIIITGHWDPLYVPGDYYDRLDSIGADVQRLHRELLPETVSLGDEGFIARLSPYQVTASAGESVTFTVEVRNPFARAVEAAIQPVLPRAWQQPAPAVLPLTLAAGGTAFVHFSLTLPTGMSARRARLAVDVSVDGHPFGQQAEALITFI